MKPRNAVFLFVAALIWGTTFAFQSMATEHIQPFSFNASRFLLGFLVLLPVIAFRRGRGVSTGNAKNSVLCGVLCGFFLWLASFLQQHAIASTEAGKTGFLTALYIVFVPLIHFMFSGKGSRKLFAGVLIAVVGMYLLSVQGAFRVSASDVNLIVCAFLYALQILTIDAFSGRVDPVETSSTQFITAAFLSGILAVALEHPAPEGFAAALGPILFAGVLSCGIAYTFQVVGQQGENPSVASLLLSLEAVFSLVAGYFLLHEELAPRKLAGCALLFLSILIVQWPEGEEKTAEERRKADA